MPVISCDSRNCTLSTPVASLASGMGVMAMDLGLFATGLCLKVEKRAQTKIHDILAACQLNM